MLYENKLHALSDTIIDLHLGHAVEQMHKSNTVAKIAKTGFETNLVIRCSLSSILHSFCASESAINMAGYEIFNNPSSKVYYPDTKRNFTLNKFINAWDSKSVLEKIIIILECAEKEPLTKNLEVRLREFNLMRNWIAHGLVYVTTLTLEETNEQDTYNVIDIKGNKNWKSKFPNTKFNEFRKLKAKDAQTALKITLEILKIISQITQKTFHFTTCENKQSVYFLWEQEFINPDFLKLD